MRPRAATTEAQAKINLGLRITGREANGYHNLETMFLRIELSDTVSVQVTSDRSLHCDDPLAGPAEENLAWRAAEAFSAETGWPGGWAIRIEKRIPIGAGLGGGSADAGAVLRILNSLAPVPLDPVTMSDIALSIGSDVPFLASDHVMTFATGRGEELHPVAPPPRQHVMLAIPGDPVRTADAFRWFDEAEHPGGRRPERTGPPRDWISLATGGHNDLEAVVSRRLPVVRACVEAFQGAGAAISAMTGSGSAVYGVFEVEPANDFPGLPEGVRIIRTHTSTEVVQPHRTG